jgi:hypothetical protein
MISVHVGQKGFALLDPRSSAVSLPAFPITRSSNFSSCIRGWCCCDFRLPSVSITEVTDPAKKQAEIGS